MHLLVFFKTRPDGAFKYFIIALTDYTFILNGKFYADYFLGEIMVWCNVSRSI